MLNKDYKKNVALWYRFLQECHGSERVNQKRMKLFYELKLQDTHTESKRSDFITILTTMVNNDVLCCNIGKFIHECFKLQTERQKHLSSD